MQLHTGTGSEPPNPGAAHRGGMSHSGRSRLFRPHRQGDVRSVGGRGGPAPVARERGRREHRTSLRGCVFLIGLTPGRTATRDAYRVEARAVQAGGRVDGRRRGSTPRPLAWQSHSHARGAGRAQRSSAAARCVSISGRRVDAHSFRRLTTAGGSTWIRIRRSAQRPSRGRVSAISRSRARWCSGNG